MTHECPDHDVPFHERSKNALCKPCYKNGLLCISEFLDRTGGDVIIRREHDSARGYHVETFIGKITKKVEDGSSKHIMYMVVEDV